MSPAKIFVVVLALVLGNPAAFSQSTAAAPSTDTLTPPVRIAQSSHTQICQDNYNQCMRGCDGAASCSNQCKVNLDGCLSQGR